MLCQVKWPGLNLNFVKTALASLTFEPDPSRHFRLPAEGSPSLIYDFGPDNKLGARAYSASGQDFEPGSTQSNVRLDFWADDPWTDVVVPGATFAIWYGGDVGHGVIEQVL